MGNVEKILVAVIMTTIVVILALAIYGLGTDPGYMENEGDQVDAATPSEREGSEPLPLKREDSEIPFPGSTPESGVGNLASSESDLTTGREAGDPGSGFEAYLKSENLESGSSNPGPSDWTNGDVGLDSSRDEMIDLEGKDEPSGQKPVPSSTRRWADLDPSPIEGMKIYQVSKGDTLSSIADRFYRKEAAWRLIQAYNKDVSPDRLSVGAQLLLPAPGTDVKSYEAKVQRRTDGRNTYVVRKGDTLFGIAKRMLKDGGQWRAIYDQNRSLLGQPSDLRPGMALVLPE